MDNDIAAVYSARGVTGVRPRYSMALIRLHHLGPMTVRALAGEVGVTHSAMSQTVTEMKREGLISSAPGADARTREVSLTSKGEDLVPFLEAEWRATEAAFDDLDSELPYSFQQVVKDMADALQRRSFRERIVQHLDSGQEE
ncbi:DNA-binding MarR family transcriptional regulator [Arthrobacter pigmenti]|uniref:DNA-binding MarR family transcriptional regulator n=1 Tax=Arthrobacter pigmenti TaxID=271432 RepID=A0A846RU90_9MICC|nr:MarR family transcriptional regulator [Arthrobacter pigmenti]NJC23707.1 DNA-binding MarR family transcriptional regulator [Arthrobacter pigmenti]